MRYNQILPKFAERYKNFLSGKEVGGQLRIHNIINAERVILTAILHTMSQDMLQKVDAMAERIMKSIEEREE